MTTTNHAYNALQSILNNAAQRAALETATLEWMDAYGPAESARLMAQMPHAIWDPVFNTDAFATYQDVIGMHGNDDAEENALVQFWLETIAKHRPAFTALASALTDAPL